MNCVKNRVLSVISGASGRWAALLSVSGWILGVESAHAGTGQPSPWQLGLQGAATPVAEDITWFHNALLTPIITVITLFVLALLIVVAIKFREKANPNPSNTTHHVGLEVAWTIIPVLILVVIAIPSFRILKDQVVIPQADLVIKATGHAWYWRFEYPKQYGGFEFEARMLTDEDRQAAIAKGAKPADVPRLLAVDNEVVVPVNKVVAVQVTAYDVLHSLAMPSFGIKADAVPGRLNQTWFKATKEGIYYGQCSEICGQLHAFMPLAIRVVSEEKYAAWLADAKKKFAAAPLETPVQRAEAEAQRLANIQ